MSKETSSPKPKHPDWAELPPEWRRVLESFVNRHPELGNPQEAWDSETQAGRGFILKGEGLIPWTYDPNAPIPWEGETEEEEQEFLSQVQDQVEVQFVPRLPKR